MLTLCNQRTRKESNRTENFQTTTALCSLTLPASPTPTHTRKISWGHLEFRSHQGVRRRPLPLPGNVREGQELPSLTAGNEPLVSQWRQWGPRGPLGHLPSPAVRKCSSPPHWGGVREGTGRARAFTAAGW